MKKNEDLSICLHRFLGDFWWMDGKCFLLVKEFLDKYCTEKHELFENFVDKVIYVTVKRRDIINNKELFQLRKLGERALLLSFKHAAVNEDKNEKLIKFEFIYKENEKIQTQKITFNIKK
ncbi:MAG: hypothetical protein H6Q12_382 [Bacteroidetes bacterium]|nr:hypothetical protein [Bacteroidota bacterium]